MDRDGSASYYIGFNGWNETNKPYLVVNYTYVPSYTWLKVNGSGSVSGTVLPGSSQQIPVSFDAGSLGIGTYTANIQISSNDPDQAQVLIPSTLTISTDRNLNLTVMLEGLYDGTGAMRKAQDVSGDHFTGTVADQVTLELHDYLNYDNIVYSAPNVNLNTNGTANTLIPAVHSGSYYITVRHRNSIETTTASPVLFSGGTITYDFSTSASQAYGNNLKPVSGKFLVYSGDVNQDGIIDSGDLIGVDNDASTFVSGYVVTNTNGDGLIDSGDMTVVDNNAGNFISSITP
ncbi:MAG: hypothetical protein IPH45_19050 [Bacteroidales bacterium]|nr:hypothetical protein [Bacteroidales bacterium]